MVLKLLISIFLYQQKCWFISRKGKKKVKKIIFSKIFVKKFNFRFHTKDGHFYEKPTFLVFQPKDEQKRGPEKLESKVLAHGFLLILTPFLIIIQFPIASSFTDYEKSTFLLIYGRSAMWSPPKWEHVFFGKNVQNTRLIYGRSICRFFSFFHAHIWVQILRIFKDFLCVIYRR